MPGMTSMASLEAQTPLLDGNIRPGSAAGWRVAAFLLGAGILERFAYYGIESNLINYLTGPLGKSVAASAANVNTWTGVVALVPVPGAFVADSFVGRYRTIIVTSLLYILGLSLMTLIAVLIKPPTDSDKNTALEIPFYVSLYLVALAQAFKPCVQAFGADQFDSKDQKKKSAFFNWWVVGLCAGSVSAHLILHYIQDNVNWGLGFGIPCLAMFVGLVIILMGNRTYHFPIRGDHEESQPESSRQGFAKFTGATLYNKTLGAGTEEGQQAVRFPDRDLAREDIIMEKKILWSCCSSWNGMLNKNIKLILIWATCLTYAIAYAQASTFFTKQATTMDKSIGQSFKLPSASLRIFIPLSLLSFLTIYDRVFVPIAGMITGKARGITMLQRIGTGMGISVFGMVTAAVVEKKRLETAREYGIVDIPNATVPMSFWWLIPQYVLYGLSATFAEVGMQEFFYDQVPSKLRSLGLSCYLGAIGIGSFLSSFLISVIQKVTSENGGDGWFSDNLNRARIDNFYWILAGIGAIGLTAFIFVANSYIYVEDKVLNHHDKTSCTN